MGEKETIRLLLEPAAMGRVKFPVNSARETEKPDEVKFTVV